MTLLKDDIIKALEEMKLSDLNKLVKEIENHFGIVSTVNISADTMGEKTSREEKSSEVVNIVLTDIGPSKVAIIKLVKEITKKDLMSAKKIVDKLPAIIKEKILLEEAEEIKGQLIAAGASIELK